MSGAPIEAAMRLHPLGGAVAEWEESAPPADRVIEGDPKFRTAIHYEAPDGRLFAGVWEASEGAWRVAYDEWEWCSLRSGRCVVTADGGEPVEIGPGDPLVLEPGFSGEWRVLEACSKDFVVLLPPAEDEA